jgi:hypothetical protein
MSCTACTSERQAEFGAEINIHFSGREGLDKPGVWIFPTLLVCLDCGTTKFDIAGAELAVLVSGTRRSAATGPTETAEDVTPP